MPAICVKIDNFLKIKKSDLSQSLLHQLDQALHIPNPKYISALKEQASTWGINKTIPMIHERNGYLEISRGFGHHLRQGLESSNKKVQFVDHRASVPIETPSEGLSLYSHQKTPVEALKKAQQGMYEASPGAGKTVVCLELWRQLKQRTIVLVDRKNIAEQWRERAREHLGIEVGLIGDDCWEEEDLTIALVQTLHAKSKSPDHKKFLQDNDWYRSWGMVIADECHHSSADSWNLVIESFPAKYRFGVSATPDRENGMFEVAKFVLGDVVHKTPKSELYENGTIVRPVVKAVKTDFTHPYYPTHTKTPDGSCMYRPECGSTGYTHRNNFNRVLAEISVCDERSALIAEHILSERGRTQIVISKRLKHLEKINSFLKANEIPTVWLTGKESTFERTEVIELAKCKKDLIILSTLADEALDIPTLEVIHLTFPTRSAPLVKQQVGRVERKSPGKISPRIYDYVDADLPILRSQFNNRLNKVYRADDYEIEWIGQDEPSRLASVL